MRNLVARYGKLTVIGNLHCRYPISTKVGIFGHNGAGKTTLLRCLIGAHLKSGGTISWNGEALPDGNVPETVSKGIAFVPQGHNVFPTLSVERNCSGSPGCRLDRIFCPRSSISFQCSTSGARSAQAGCSRRRAADARAWHGLDDASEVASPRRTFNGSCPCHRPQRHGPVARRECPFWNGPDRRRAERSPRRSSLSIGRSSSSQARSCLTVQQPTSRPIRIFGNGFLSVKPVKNRCGRTRSLGKSAGKPHRLGGFRLCTIPAGRHPLSRCAGANGRSRRGRSRIDRAGSRSRTPDRNAFPPAGRERVFSQPTRRG